MGAVRLAGAALWAFWRLARPVLRWALQIVLALLILLEEWGWQPLAELAGRLARWQPWARLETAIARLPPYAALAVFVLPSTLLLPLKFLALLLIAKGYLALAGLLFAAAKVGATALVARLFLLTKPALMQIGWFAWGYDRFIPWKNALESYVRSSTVWRVGRVWKVRAKRAAAVQWQRMRPALLHLREAGRLAPPRGWPEAAVPDARSRHAGPRYSGSGSPTVTAAHHRRMGCRGPPGGDRRGAAQSRAQPAGSPDSLVFATTATWLSLALPPRGRSQPGGSISLKRTCQPNPMAPASKRQLTLAGADIRDQHPRSQSERLAKP
jgi:hypothetical protein